MQAGCILFAHFLAYYLHIIFTLLIIWGNQGSLGGSDFTRFGKPRKNAHQTATMMLPIRGVGCKCSQTKTAKYAKPPSSHTLVQILLKQQSKTIHVRVHKYRASVSVSHCIVALLALITQLLLLSCPLVYMCIYII